MILESARAKHGRANEHLELLAKQVARFLKNDPYPVTKKFDAKGSRYVWTVKRLREPPEFTWGLLIGDCVHNFRAALDHAVWELSERFDGPDPTDTATQFPIQRSRFRDDQIARIGPCAKAIIKWLQPGSGFNLYGDALERLHALDIADKHKVTTVTAAVTKRSRVRKTKQVPPVRADVNWNLQIGNFRHNAEIADLRILSTDPPNSKVKVDADFFFDIAFGQGWPLKRELVVPCLSALSYAVRDIIVMLELTGDTP